MFSYERLDNLAVIQIALIGLLGFYRSVLRRARSVVFLFNYSQLVNEFLSCMLYVERV